METMSTGEDDDMEKKAICLGRILNGVGTAFESDPI